MMGNMTMVVRSVMVMTVAWFGIQFAYAQNASPDQLARTVLQDVIPEVQKMSKGKDWNQETAAKLIETKVSPYFNFTRMTAIAVGRNWRSATPEQKTALVNEFHKLIVRTYANTLLGYKNETITVQPLPESESSKSSTTVRAQVNRSSGGPIRVDLSVEKNGNTWKVYDVIISGVSMVMNFRETFNTQVRDNGIDGLIKMLADRNKQPSTAGDKK